MTQEYVDNYIAPQLSMTSSDELTFDEHEPVTQVPGWYYDRGLVVVPQSEIQMLMNQQYWDKQCIYNLTQKNYDLNQEIASITRDKLYLYNELQKSCWKAEALSKLYKLQGNAYFAVLSNGQTRQITSFAFESVTLRQFDRLYGKKPVVWITFSNQTTASIDADAFMNNKKLLLWLENVTHTSIEQYASEAKIAWLLRSIAAQMMKTEIWLFYGGWKRKGNEYYYFTTPTFQTSRESNNSEPVQFTEEHSTLRGNALSATRRFIEAFSGLRSKALRTICALWIHATFLATLYFDQRIALPRVLVFSEQNAVYNQYLRELFSIGRELLFMAEPDAFLLGLVSQKDQPLVLLDNADGRNSYVNKSALRKAMVNGTVSIQRGKETVERPILTMPVVISGGGTMMLGSECSIPIDINPGEDFDFEKCMEIITNKEDFSTYFSNFVAYTADHIQNLTDCLNESQETALRNVASHDLPIECAETLRVLEGVSSFLKNYYREISLPSESMDEIITEGWVDRIIDAMEEGLAENVADGLADLFFEAARTAIENKHIGTRFTSRELTEISPGAVYFDGKSFCFDRRAFETVCHNAGIHAAAVKKELAERSLFYMKAANDTTYLRRISVRLWGETKPKTILVYRFDRNLIDKPGEPSLVEDMGDE